MANGEKPDSRGRLVRGSPASQARGRHDFATLNHVSKEVIIFPKKLLKFDSRQAGSGR
jgi:hypothetical protein